MKYNPTRVIQNFAQFKENPKNLAASYNVEVCIIQRKWPVCEKNSKFVIYPFYSRYFMASKTMPFWFEAVLEKSRSQHTQSTKQTVVKAFCCMSSTFIAFCFDTCVWAFASFPRTERDCFVSKNKKKSGWMEWKPSLQNCLQNTWQFCQKFPTQTTHDAETVIMLLAFVPLCGIHSTHHCEHLNWWKFYWCWGQVLWQIKQ